MSVSKLIFALAIFAAATVTHAETQEEIDQRVMAQCDQVFADYDDYLSGRKPLLSGTKLDEDLHTCKTLLSAMQKRILDQMQ